MKSIWSQDIEKPAFETLNGDIKTDVLIIGGGMAGLLCAFELSNAGVDYILVEADKICGGITRNTTAKITVHHGLIYSKLINTFGIEKAKLYLSAQLSALERYRELCKNIDCSFKETDSYVYSLNNRCKIEEEISALKKLGFDASFTEGIPLPFEISGAVKTERQAQFHPLKFAFHIAKGLNIYENTKVLELTPNGAVTNHGKIKAKRIIVTTHFPFINKHGGYFLKMFQERSYVLAVKNAANVNGIYIDESKKGLSFRNFEDLLLIGGSNHRTGKKSKGWNELSAFAKKYYPDSIEVARWATQDCITLDSMPYIGRYSKDTENMFVATGFNKWGMSSSMVAAQILKSMITDKKSPYTEVFSPDRSILRPQLAINVTESMIGLLSPTKPRCPHLGCALKYNSAEHSWDCPCHGSRFEKNGRLINNPATDDKIF